MDNNYAVIRRYAFGRDALRPEKNSQTSKKLIEILQTLVNKGNTVVVIEHNMDVIKSADYLVDIGPDGGVDGGNIVATGTPEEVSRAKNSYTGQYLKKVL